MAIPNIASLLIERERRSIYQYSGARAQHGVTTFNNYLLVPGTIQTGLELDGFIFGRDIWGVGTFSTETSPLGEKYGIQ